MFSKRTFLLITAIPMLILAGGTSLSFGQQLRLDTQIETPAQNNDATELPEKQAGDTIQFQLFASGASGRRIQGYTVELALRGKTFADYFDQVSGADLNGGTLLSRVSGTGNPTLSMLSVSAVAVPVSGYLGQVNLSVGRGLTSSDVLEVPSASIAVSGGVQNLDVTQAMLSFTAAAACRGDFDGNGMVNLSDFLAFAGAFGTRSGDANYDARIDMDGNGTIDLSDFLAFAEVFGTTCEVAPPTVNPDRQALIALYNATNGTNWANKTNWISDRPLGDWYGVTTDDAGRVTRLLLGNNELSGPVPEELSRLSNLKWLYLGHNQLSGPVPEELSRLSNLQRLNLRSNELSGPIPVELSRLSNLELLYLGRNQLSGPVPEELSRLSNLVVLSLSRNQLSGAVPVELSRVSNLEWLLLDHNQLSGAVPVELSRVSNLVWLRLGNNQLTGSIPAALGSLSNLEELSLDHNQLSGPVPVELSRLSNLTGLFLNDNAGLSGPLPGSFARLDSLSHLYLNGTGLCAPTDAAFQTWLQGVENKRGVTECAGGSPGKMYWTDAAKDKIQRANLDGSGIEDLVTLGLGFPDGIALDTVAAKMYWTVRDKAKIQRANLDGSGVEDLVTSVSGSLSGIALDLGVAKMYWMEYGPAKIRRANLDGSGVDDLITSGLNSPRNIALDPRAGKMYWTDWGTGKIQRANLDGTGVEDLVSVGGNALHGIALDLGAGKIYWTNVKTGRIQRANLDGTGVEDLVTSGLQRPGDIALDPGAGKMYWTDWGTGKIQRANLDGRGVEDLVASQLQWPFGIALDISGHRDGIREFHSTFEQPTRSESVVVDGIQIEAAENEVLVFLDEDVSSQEVRDTRAVILTQGGRVKSLNIDLRTIQVGITDAIVEQDFIDALDEQPGVSGAGVNEVVEPDQSYITSNEQGYRQWLPGAASKRVLDVPPPSPVSFAGDFWIDQIDATSAWTALSDPGVMLAPNKIGIVDTGIPASQDVLNSSRISRYTEQGVSLSGDDTTHRHGLNVTGYAAGYGNGPDRRGVNPHSDVVFVDVLRSGKKTYVTSLLLGIKAAIDQDAGVVNVSWGDRTDCDNSSAERVSSRQRWRLGKTGAVHYARKHDVLLVWSAGNNCEKHDDRLLPLDESGDVDIANTDSWLSHTMIVGASTDSQMDACFSRMGGVVNITAPGEQVGFGTGAKNGTSFAAPMVAGAAGLIRAIESTISAEETRSILINSARNAISFNTDCEEPAVASTPAGLLNLGSAIQSSLVANGVGLNTAGDILLTRGQTQAVQIDVTVPSGGANAIDVGFVIDQSGSYEDDIKTLQSRVTDIVNGFGSRSGVDVQFGVVGFADFPQDPYGGVEDVPYRLYQSITNDAEALIAAVDRLNKPLMWGGDDPESQYEALNRATREIGWRDGALRILLLATDDDFHDSDTESGYPGTGRKAALATLAAENVIVVGLQSGGSIAAARHLQELADATGGSVLSLDAASSQIVAAIESGLDAALAEVDVTLEVLAGHSWVDIITPAIHQDVRGGRTVSFTVFLEGQRGPSIEDLPYNVYLWARGDGSALLSRTKIPIIVPGE